MKFRQDILVTVEVEITDPLVVQRPVENKEGWRGVFYADLSTPEQVVQHLAYNAALNHVGRANALDGWADLDGAAATMHVVDAVPDGEPEKVS